jgi:hypothetical protein
MNVKIINKNKACVWFDTSGRWKKKVKVRMHWSHFGVQSNNNNNNKKEKKRKEIMVLLTKWSMPTKIFNFHEWYYTFLTLKNHSLKNKTFDVHLM